MNSTAMNFINVGQLDSTLSPKIISEIMINNEEYHPIFIYIELNLDKTFFSNENVTVVVLRPKHSESFHVQDIEITESDLTVLLKENLETGAYYLDQTEDDQTDIDISLSAMKIEHCIICNEEENQPLSIEKLKDWIEEKYLVNERKAVAVSFYTFKKKENVYNEIKYFKSIFSYRYIFKSYVD